jgi:hypothetical protein
MAFLTARRAFGRYLNEMTFSPRPWRNDFSADRCAVHDGPADRRVVAVGDQQDTPDRDGLAGLSVEQLDFEFRADFHAVLLSAGLDDCVHGSSGCVDDGGQMRGRSGCRTWVTSGMDRDADGGVYG